MTTATDYTPTAWRRVAARGLDAAYTDWMNARLAADNAAREGDAAGLPALRAAEQAAWDTYHNAHAAAAMHWRR